MDANHTKVAAVAIGLLSTWATAHADDFTVSVTPSAGMTLDNVQIFSASTTTTGTSTNAGTTTQGNEALSANLGSATGSNTLSTKVSTSYGTSTTESGHFDGTDATFGLLATSNGFAVLSAASGTTTYAGAFGSTGVTQAQALNGIQSGSLSATSSLFPNMTSNSLDSASDFGGPLSGNLFAFDASGKASSIGTWFVTPQAVPEPASIAALGVGAMGLMRRRRKLA